MLSFYFLITTIRQISPYLYASVWVCWYLTLISMVSSWYSILISLPIDNDFPLIYIYIYIEKLLPLDQKNTLSKERLRRYLVIIEKYRPQVREKPIYNNNNIRNKNHSSSPFFCDSIDSMFIFLIYSYSYSYVEPTSSSHDEWIE